MITGRVKFFEPQLADISQGARATWLVPAVGRSNRVDEILSLNPRSYWQGSDRGPAGNVIHGEIIDISFDTFSSVDTFFLLRHNVNDFRIELSSPPLPNIQASDINNVRTLIGSITSRNSVRLDDGDYMTYIKIDPPVRINRIRLGLVGAGPLNQSPVRLGTFIATRELGGLEGYPEIKKFSFSQNEQRTKAKDGRFFINKQERRLENLRMRFRNYVEIADQDLVSGIFNRENPFLLWPSGGYQGFRFDIDGFKIDDIYKMQTVGKFNTGLSRGSYSGVMNFDVKFVESV